MRHVALSVLECGRCRHPQAMAMRGASWRPADFPSLVGVIRHPTEGVILFDTGYSPAFLDATRTFPERLYRWTTPVDLKPGESAAERLATLGIPVADVAHVVISHFHGDHVAGLRDFPAARLHCARTGLDDMRSMGRLARVRHGLLDALVPDEVEHADFFEDASVVNLPRAFRPFEAGADVLGDGSMVAVPLPGHCPGHWGLAMRIDDDRHVLMVGDAAWSLDAIERNVMPPAITTALLGDGARQRETLAILHDMTGREDVALIPSHCRRASSDAGLIA